MKIDKIGNAKRNIIYGIVNKIVYICLPFVNRTVFIYILGAEYLGLDGLFTSVLQILNIAELGFSRAIIYYLYKPIAEDDTVKICSLLNYIRKVYRIIGLIVLMFGICIIPFLSDLIHGSVPHSINIYLLYLIYLCNTVLGYWMFAYKATLLNAHQRVDIIINVDSIIKLCQFILQAVFLLIFKNYYLYLIIIPFFTFFNNILVNINAKRLYPNYICKGFLDSADRHGIRKKISGLLIQKVCEVSRNSIDNIVLSVYAGLITVSIYGNYYYVMIGLISFKSILIRSIEAAIGNNIVVKSVEDNHRDMHTYTFIYAWISGVCTICLLCLFQPFMRLWMGNSLLLSFPCVIVICIYFYALSIGDIRMMYIQGNGLWWERRYGAIVEAVCNIILDILLGKYYGVFGIVLATVISILCINFPHGSYILYKHYFKNGKLKTYIGKHLYYGMVVYFTSVITYWICNSSQDGKIVNLFKNILICLIVPNIIFCIFFFFTDEFKDTVAKIRELRNKF